MGFRTSMPRFWRSNGCKLAFCRHTTRKASLVLPTPLRVERSLVLWLSFGGIPRKPRRPRLSFEACEVVMKGQASGLPQRCTLRSAELAGSGPASLPPEDPLPKTLSAGANDGIIWMGHSETHGG